jgi:hypothetical protein
MLDQRDDLRHKHDTVRPSDQSASGKGARRNDGMELANPTTPSSTSEPGILYTAHGRAIRCIQVPIREILCPLKNNR